MYESVTNSTPSLAPLSIQVHHVNNILIKFKTNLNKAFIFDYYCSMFSLFIFEDFIKYVLDSVDCTDTKAKWHFNIK